MRKYIWRIGGALIVLAVIVALGPAFLSPGSEAGGGEPPGAGAGRRSGLISLARLAFARTVGAQFPAQFPANEAGIAAHMNKGRTIDLGRAREILWIVWRATEDYVIGTVALPGLEEHQWPHAFISRDGWIVVYHPKGRPLSKLMGWEGWSPGDAITTTTLRDALLLLVRELGFPIARVDADMRYFHFQYPDAAIVLIVLDWTRDSDSFQYSIPADVILHEAGWSHRGVGLARGVGLGRVGKERSESLIGETRLYRGGGGTYSRFGHLEAAHLAPGTMHTATLRTPGLEADEWMALALVFIYQPLGN